MSNEVGAGNRGGKNEFGWFTFPWSGHGRHAGFSYGGGISGSQQLDVVPLGVQHREPGHSVHADVHPAADHDAGRSSRSPTPALAASDDPAAARRSAGGDRRWCLGRAEDRRHRTATRRTRPGDHDDRRPRLRRRQVLRRPRHRERVNSSTVRTSRRSIGVPVRGSRRSVRSSTAPSGISNRQAAA